jgi:MYXO-CTERM domain-containing protein
MNKWTLKFLAAAGVGVLSLAGQANAAVSYSYTTDQTDYAATPGQALNVKVYLLETLTGGSTSVVNADGGMLGVGVKGTKTAGPAGASTLGAVTLNGTDFAGPTNKEEGAAGFRLTEAIAAAAGTPGVQTGNTGGNAANAKASSVYLGSVAVTAGTDPGATTFQLLPYDNLGGNSLTLNNFYDVDFSSANPAFTGASGNPTSFTVTVTAVPEPTFAAAALVLGAAGALRRRRQMA